MSVGRRTIEQLALAVATANVEPAFLDGGIGHGTISEVTKTFNVRQLCVRNKLLAGT